MAVSALVGSTHCLPLPLNLLSRGESLEMVWPQRLGSISQCSCPPFEGSRMLFTTCAAAASCNTEYSVSILNNSLACFSDLTPEQNNTPVYFTIVRDITCLEEGRTTKQCYIRRIASSYNIMVTG